MNQYYTIMKHYLLAMFDLFLFSMAAWDGLDHGLRSIAAIGGIVVLIYTIRKIKRDIDLKRIQHERESVELQIRQQELFRLMEDTKKRSNGKQ